MQGEWVPGLMCTGRVDIPFVQNVIEAKWSPDSKRIALTAGQRTPSTTSPVGWKEQEVVYTFDLRSGALSVVGAGIRPEWSTTGTYLSYWPEDEDLRVMRGDKIEAKLLMSIPEVRWVGDKLLYIYKRDIREWANGEIRIVARFDKDFEPAYPLDDVYWSADGTRFTLMRYSYDGRRGALHRKDRRRIARAAGCARRTHMEWSPTGDTLLVRYPNKLELIGPDGAVRARRSRSPVRSLVDGGRTITCHRPSLVHDARGRQIREVRRLGRGAGHRGRDCCRISSAHASSVPNGRYFTGVSRERLDSTRLELYRCGTWSDEEWNVQGDPDAQARLDRIEGDELRLLRPVPGDVAQFRQFSHTGVDIAAPVGSMIVAADTGTVSKIGWQGVGGQGVCVSHGGGLESCYFHIVRRDRDLGQRVVRGQPVALVGMTGITTGPHVHWEAKLFGQLIDPLSR